MYLSFFPTDFGRAIKNKKSRKFHINWQQRELQTGYRPLEFTTLTQ